MTFEATVAFPSVKGHLAERMRTFHNERLPELEILALPGYSSFFAAWEAAIDEASSDVLILTHEDVRILGLPPSPLWSSFAEEPKLGMMGVAGTKEIKLPEFWWYSNTRYQTGILSGEIFHDTPQMTAPTKSVFGNFGNVVVLDGVCLITTKERLARILPECKKHAYATWDFYDHVVSLEFVKAGYYLRTCPLRMIHDSAGGDKRPSFMTSGQRFAAEYLVDTNTGAYRTWSV